MYTFWFRVIFVEGGLIVSFTQVYLKIESSLSHLAHWPGGDICVWYLYVYISALEFSDKLSVSHSLLLVTLNNEQFTQCSCREWYCKFYMGKFANLSSFQYLLLLIIQERAMTLCDVTYLDYIVHVMCMVHGLQLQYWFSVSTYNISQIIWHTFRWHFLLLILHHFCHCKFQFSCFLYVMIHLSI